MNLKFQKVPKFKKYHNLKKVQRNTKENKKINIKMKKSSKQCYRS